MATNDPPTTGEQAEPNTLKDQYGVERKWDGDRYPEGSAAREGHITKPSGQGGATPKARPDHQDMFPQNPPPSESAREKAAENERIAKGEDVTATSPVLAKGSGKEDKR